MLESWIIKRIHNNELYRDIELQKRAFLGCRRRGAGDDEPDEIIPEELLEVRPVTEQELEKTAAALAQIRANRGRVKVKFSHR